MVVLTEQIEIPASYEKLKAWTANFEEEFVKWSPYHIECNLYYLESDGDHSGYYAMLYFYNGLRWIWR